MLKWELPSHFELSLPGKVHGQFFGMFGLILPEAAYLSANKAILLLGSLHAIYRLLDLVFTRDIAVFGVLNGVLISDLKEHLLEELMSGRRDVISDIHHQLLDLIVVVKKQDELTANDDLERHHAYTPEVPVFAPLSRGRVDLLILVIVGHDGLDLVVDRLAMEGQSADITERHLLALFIDEDARWLQQSTSDLGLDQLSIHQDKLLDEEMATRSHGASLSHHVPEAILLALDLETEPILRDMERLEVRDELELPLDGGLGQPESLGNLMRKELIIHVLGGAPCDQV